MRKRLRKKTWPRARSRLEALSRGDQERSRKAYKLARMHLVAMHFALASAIDPRDRIRDATWAFRNVMGLQPYAAYHAKRSRLILERLSKQTPQ